MTTHHPNSVLPEIGQVTDELQIVPEEKLFVYETENGCNIWYAYYDTAESNRHVAWWIKKIYFRNGTKYQFETIINENTFDKFVLAKQKSANGNILVTLVSLSRENIRKLCQEDRQIMDQSLLFGKKKTRSGWLFSVTGLVCQGIFSDQNIFEEGLVLSAIKSIHKTRIMTRGKKELILKRSGEINQNSFVKEHSFSDNQTIDGYFQQKIITVNNEVFIIHRTIGDNSSKEIFQGMYFSESGEFYTGFFQGKLKQGPGIVRYVSPNTDMARIFKFYDQFCQFKHSLMGDMKQIWEKSLSDFVNQSVASNTTILFKLDQKNFDRFIKYLEMQTEKARSKPEAKVGIGNIHFINLVHKNHLILSSWNDYMQKLDLLRSAEFTTLSDIKNLILERPLLKFIDMDQIYEEFFIDQNHEWFKKLYLDIFSYRDMNEHTDFDEIGQSIRRKIQIRRITNKLDSLADKKFELKGFQENLIREFSNNIYKIKCDAANSLDEFTEEIGFAGNQFKLVIILTIKLYLLSIANDVNKQQEFRNTYLDFLLNQKNQNNKNIFGENNEKEPVSLDGISSEAAIELVEKMSDEQDLKAAYQQICILVKNLQENNVNHQINELKNNWNKKIRNLAQKGNEILMSFQKNKESDISKLTKRIARVHVDHQISEFKEMLQEASSEDFIFLFKNLLFELVITEVHELLKTDKEFKMSKIHSKESTIEKQKLYNEKFGKMTPDRIKLYLDDLFLELKTWSFGYLEKEEIQLLYQVGTDILTEKTYQTGFQTFTSESRKNISYIKSNSQRIFKKSSLLYFKKQILTSQLGEFFDIRREFEQASSGDQFFDVIKNHSFINFRYLNNTSIIKYMMTKFWNDAECYCKQQVEKDSGLVKQLRSLRNGKQIIEFLKEKKILVTKRDRILAIYQLQKKINQNLALSESEIFFLKQFCEKHISEFSRYFNNDAYAPLGDDVINTQIGFNNYNVDENFQYAKNQSVTFYFNEDDEVNLDLIKHRLLSKKLEFLDNEITKLESVAQSLFFFKKKIDELIESTGGHVAEKTEMASFLSPNVNNLKIEKDQYLKMQKYFEKHLSSENQFLTSFLGNLNQMYEFNNKIIENVIEQSKTPESYFKVITNDINLREKVINQLKESEKDLIEHLNDLNTLDDYIDDPEIEMIAKRGSMMNGRQRRRTTILPREERRISSMNEPIERRRVSDWNEPIERRRVSTLNEQNDGKRVSTINEPNELKKLISVNETNDGKRVSTLNDSNPRRGVSGRIEPKEDLRVSFRNEPKEARRVSNSNEFQQEVNKGLLNTQTLNSVLKIDEMNLSDEEALAGSPVFQNKLREIVRKEFISLNFEGLDESLKNEVTLNLDKIREMFVESIIQNLQVDFIATIKSVKTQHIKNLIESKKNLRDKILGSVYFSVVESMFFSFVIEQEIQFLLDLISENNQFDFLSTCKAVYLNQREFNELSTNIKSALTAVQNEANLSPDELIYLLECLESNIIITSEQQLVIKRKIDEIITQKQAPLESFETLVEDLLEIDDQSFYEFSMEGKTNIPSKINKDDIQTVRDLIENRTNEEAITDYQKYSNTVLEKFYKESLRDFAAEIEKIKYLKRCCHNGNNTPVFHEAFCDYFRDERHNFYSLDVMLSSAKETYFEEFDQNIKNLDSNLKEKEKFKLRFMLNDFFYDKSITLTRNQIMREREIDYFWSQPGLFAKKEKLTNKCQALSTILDDRSFRKIFEFDDESDEIGKLTPMINSEEKGKQSDFSEIAEAHAIFLVKKLKLLYRKKIEIEGKKNILFPYLQKLNFDQVYETFLNYEFSTSSEIQTSMILIGEFDKDTIKYGIQIDASGNIYIGSFVNNRYEGEGVMVTRESQSTFSGYDFKRDGNTTTLEHIFRHRWRCLVIQDKVFDPTATTLDIPFIIEEEERIIKLVGFRVNLVISRYVQGVQKEIKDNWSSNWRPVGSVNNISDDSTGWIGRMKKLFRRIAPQNVALKSLAKRNAYTLVDFKARKGSVSLNESIVSDNQIDHFNLEGKLQS